MKEIKNVYVNKLSDEEQLIIVNMLEDYYFNNLVGLIELNEFLENAYNSKVNDLNDSVENYNHMIKQLEKVGK